MSQTRDVQSLKRSHISNAWCWGVYCPNSDTACKDAGANQLMWRIGISKLADSRNNCRWEVKAWKQWYCPSYIHDKEKNAPLGTKYWKSFMKWHGHRIKAKKGVKFDNKRADWCTYGNFKTMYAEVYEEMVSGRIAHKLNAPVWLNKWGEIVELENESFGLKTPIGLT